APSSFGPVQALSLIARTVIVGRSKISRKANYLPSQRPQSSRELLQILHRCAYAQGAGQVALDHRRMNVAFAAHCRRVAKLLRHLADDLHRTFPRGLFLIEG